MGIQVGPPQMIRLPDDRIETYVNGIKQHFHDRVTVKVVLTRLLWLSLIESRVKMVRIRNMIDLSHIY